MLSIDFYLEYSYASGFYDWLRFKTRMKVSLDLYEDEARKIGERSRAIAARVHRRGPCRVRPLVRVSVLCVVSSRSISLL